MRSLASLMLGAIACLGLSSSAAAFAINMTTTYAGESLDVSDTVTVDVFVDADPGLTLMTVAVVYDNDGQLVYDGAASIALPPNPTCTAGPICQPRATDAGSQPSYILYTGGKGATILYPQQVPMWLNWPNPLVGQEQVNLNYAEPSFGAAGGSGTGIWIGTLVFRVSTIGDGDSFVNLCPIAGGSVSIPPAGNACRATIFQTGGIANPTIIDGADIPRTGDVPVNVPEPALASLALAGLSTLYVVYRRRRRA